MGRGAESERVGLFRVVTPGEGRESGGRFSGLREMADPNGEKSFSKFLWPRAPGAWFFSQCWQGGGCLLEEVWTAGCR